MNDPMEERLERLRPAELSPALMQRLLAAQPEPIIVPAAQRDVKIVRGPWFSRLAWAAAAAAVAVATLIFWPSKQPSQPLAQSESRVFTAVNSKSYLINADDLGVVAPKPDHPFRLVRCVWLDDGNYRSNDGGSSMRLAGTRVQIVPVALETY